MTPGVCWDRAHLQPISVPYERISYPAAAAVSVMYLNVASEQSVAYSARFSFSASIHELRETVSCEHSDLKQRELETMPKASHGYGGKFGVQEDRMDKVKAASVFSLPLL